MTNRRRALVSVYDKTRLSDLGRSLADLGFEIVSSGTTASALSDARVPVTPVSEVTGFAEMLDGRVKTLHPRIHAGILADRRNAEHMRQLRERGIEPFEVVVCNLYPFTAAVAPDTPTDDAIELIDVGGPAMVRAAAKNFESVAVLVRPEDYDGVLEELRSTGDIARETRLRLARQAFAHTASYDAAIAEWFGAQVSQRARASETLHGGNELPERIEFSLRRIESLRYGENPHQRGAVYSTESGGGPLDGARVLQGIEMSFINWLDAAAARAVAGMFDRPAAAIVKHENPCGVALGSSLLDAYERALDSDRISAFGGIVGFNERLDARTAEEMVKVVTHVVVAPGYSDDALAVLRSKKNLRVVRAPLPKPRGLEIRPIDGGALVHDLDDVVETREQMTVVTSHRPGDDQWADLLFAWKIAARVKSNAIVLARDGATVGIGAGQMNRLYSVDIAARHAGDRAKESVLASDAFFPFRDGIDRAAEAGVAAIIQPGGSIKDDEVVAAANEHGIAMVFTGRRHFRH